MASSSSATTVARSWRTAFLTLRDETSSGSPAGTSIGELLHNLIFSNSDSLISAASDLPPDEVTSDVLFLLELVAHTLGDREDIILAFTRTCHLIYSLCQRVSFEFNSSSLALILNAFRNVIVFFLGKAAGKAAVSPSAARFKPVIECLETIKRLTSVYQGKFSPLENIQLVKFLLHILGCSHAEFVSLYNSSVNQRSTADTGKRLAKCTSLWEIQALAFTMLGEAFSRAGSVFPVEIWQSTVEVLKKAMDVLASKSVLVEDNVLSRFYSSLLNCLHLVLADPKSSLSDHLSGFVAALRLFFVYGLTSRPQLTSVAVGHNEQDLVSLNFTSQEPKKKDNIPYRPPHLRKKDSLSIKQPKAQNYQVFSDHESSTVDFTSSDSEYSDSDGSLKDTDNVRSSKVRVAAIVCLQDLCQADPKSFTTQWTILLPTDDVLRPRKFEATLMTCLLFDPYLKVRIASASTLAVMMDGPSTVFLQVAEYKESIKYGSFMPLSSSLGRILMQLHNGILYLIQHEKHDRLMASLFKILMLLISCTPYSRMPGQLMQTVITSLRARIEEGFPFKNDQTGLLAAAISCLTAALSTSPSPPQVKEMFLEEISAGSAEADKGSGVLFTLFKCSERLTSPIICFEALQALRAVSHNYPNIISSCWKQVSTIVFKILKADTPEPTKVWKGHVGNTAGFTGEKVVTASIKVLDESLRAISGFKGTEDPLDDKLVDTPFTSDCIRIKKVSSAPLYEQESLEDIKEAAKASESGIDQWSETIQKHMPLILHHTSAMVRTASVTCFAGITSSVFFSLAKETQEFIISSLIDSALHDEVPSVRSAACRAIGVISCFPQVAQSAEILGKFIHAVEINTCDPLGSVRITASWALANICDSLRHCVDDFPFKPSADSNANSQLMESLTECALRLTKDGDKIKSNAVRSLGNLSRFVKYKCLYHPASLGDSSWLERMVQAFLSCVTTGNVKVQWNVCHALSNLFLNETLNLQEMDWAPSVFSILLLLLRDSSNFKIRIQAAAALAVPSSVSDYGKSYSDVVQGLEHILENLGADQISAPSNFKYRVALQKQLTSTMLHVLSLSSCSDRQPLKDFLVKKSSFLEEWFKGLCLSLKKTGIQVECENSSVGNQKKEIISKAIRSLIEVYEDRNQHAIAKKFEMLNSSIE
ncbi:HEAT repeat-containing protein 6 [Melia azedarach]|uniref:HEAT repeat-containing protein 6 n=1 Tax=Melia azedarach TaxID=155640 RepID=A0ACC1XJV9_MELAZ|nr:HEAT repeat-containing protein 6 [Melia azedarach]